VPVRSLCGFCMQITDFLSRNHIVLYGFSLAYLVAPGTFDSATIVEVVSGLPDFVKYTGKALLAAPFAFHSLNGLRHLSWDMGRCTFYPTTNRAMLTIVPVSFNGEGSVWSRICSIRCYGVINCSVGIDVGQTNRLEQKLCGLSHLACLSDSKLCSSMCTA